jgi:hypothetical protein
MLTKPSIVFCHGIWADGSCFNKVIPALQADGHEVMAAQALQPAASPRKSFAGSFRRGSAAVGAPPV